MHLPLFENGHIVAGHFEDLVGPGLLCAFDFDGTLAPIMAQPDKVVLPLGIQQRLLTLSELAPVAIITGRSLDDIAPRLGFTPDFTIGNHGLEGLPGWEARAPAYEELCRGWKEELTALGQADGLDPGIWIEDKRYSLSLHYRLTRNPALVGAHLAVLFERLEPAPRVVGGKSVYNLLPANALDKGAALERLLAACGARSALYAGDDTTDEDVFRLPRRDLLSVRVERSPDSAAQFYLQHRTDMFHLLDELARRLREQGAHNWVAAARRADG
jgi:trehalose 6-phosphate phosphatase